MSAHTRGQELENCQLYSSVDLRDGGWSICRGFWRKGGEGEGGRGQSIHTLILQLTMSDLRPASDCLPPGPPTPNAPQTPSPPQHVCPAKDRHTGFLNNLSMGPRSPLPPPPPPSSSPSPLFFPSRHRATFLVELLYMVPLKRDLTRQTNSCIARKNVFTFFGCRTKKLHTT